MIGQMKYPCYWVHTKPLAMFRLPPGLSFQLPVDASTKLSLYLCAAPLGFWCEDSEHRFLTFQGMTESVPYCCRPCPLKPPLPSTASWKMSYEQCRAKAPLRPCLFAPPPLQRAQRPQQPLPCIGKTSAWMDGTFQERRRTVGSNGPLAHTFHLYQRVLSGRGAPGAESRRQCAPSPSRWMIPAPRGRIRRCPKRRCPKGG
mmetsp:Transcript_4559/g.8507  ORF Transcript_4559/g.8507 Transcript_4559/m.8507 type:complete len:201 (-) Transcript_4559:199-801(-)